MTCIFSKNDLHCLGRWPAFWLANLDQWHAFLSRSLVYFWTMICVFLIFSDEKDISLCSVDFFGRWLAFFRTMTCKFRSMTCIFESIPCIFWTMIYVFLLFADDEGLSPCSVDYFGRWLALFKSMTCIFRTMPCILLNDDLRFFNIADEKDISLCSVDAYISGPK